MTDDRQQNPWRAPHDGVRCAPGVLDLWRIGMPSHRPLLPQLLSVLDDAQRQRCDAYRFDHLRERYAIRHGVMRVILAHYLAPRSPRDITFATGGFGKPGLIGGGGVPRFNLSDSGDIAVLAVSGDREVGVDVEQVRTDHPPLEIVPELAPAEQMALAALSPEDRVTALYRIWVRKEAYLKARGDGLSRDLSSFCVPSERRAGAFAAVVLPPAIKAQEEWQSHDFEPEPDCVGCVVACGTWSGLRCWDAMAEWVGANLRSSAHRNYLDLVPPGGYDPKLV